MCLTFHRHGAGWDEVFRLVQAHAHSINSLDARARRRKQTRGFTLIELMVVVAIIVILRVSGGALRAVAADRARSGAQAGPADDAQRHPAVHAGQAGAPQSLADLVSSGYLREIPVDPTMRGHDWHTDFEDTLLRWTNYFRHQRRTSTSDSASLEGAP